MSVGWLVRILEGENGTSRDNGRLLGIRIVVPQTKKIV